jgi:hypothetical protein
LPSFATRAAALLATAAAVAVLPTSAAHAASPLQLGRIQYDSPGTDTRTNGSLNAEYVTIKNLGSSARSLTGFTVRDAQNHVYKFGSFTLRAGRTVRLHTGHGTNTSTDRYWGSGNYIWNNTGDKAILRTAAGATLDTCSWSRTGIGYTSC